jgi:hypothetical protein
VGKPRLWLKDATVGGSNSRLNEFGRGGNGCPRIAHVLLSTLNQKINL